ncbi:hypothetical protein PHET_06386 [Paragonimus heterotremus]|uniref:Dolichyl-diphosphooligosaccharide--protein glycosyltransferase subunit 4 n=1 Tax=Paragonimus heterotremus TaxID=100268 RepID=A0A8J4T8U8_9TREM|nr:hypothetical protein PHET_06386 [Paragonimus heterotremus]
MDQNEAFVSSTRCWTDSINKIMITDTQLSVFANIGGAFLFLLVVLYHYVTVNQKSSKLVRRKIKGVDTYDQNSKLE